MKTLIALLVLSSITLAQSPATKPSSDAFDKLKSLAGDWKGKNGKGEETNINNKLTAGDSTVMETLKMHGDMVTMYTWNNTSVLMTHYCVAGNQPRMTAGGLSDDGKTLDF